MPTTVSTQSKNMIKRIQVSREEFLKAKPLCHPNLEWEEDEKVLHVKIPRKQTLRVRIFSFLPIPRKTRVA